MLASTLFFWVLVQLEVSRHSHVSASAIPRGSNGLIVAGQFDRIQRALTAC